MKPCMIWIVSNYNHGHTEIIGEILHEINIWPIATNGDDFPFAEGLIYHPNSPINIVMLHLINGGHELGWRKTNNGYSTGLVRAEILRENGFQGEIILIEASSIITNMTPDFEQRVKKAHINFVDYGEAWSEGWEKQITNAINHATMKIETIT